MLQTPEGRSVKIPGQIVHLNKVTIANLTPEQVKSVDMHVSNPEMKSVTAKEAIEAMRERREGPSFQVTSFLHSVLTGIVR